MTKDSHQPAQSLVLFRDAAAACVKYPSKAPDAESDPIKRVAKLFLQRCINFGLRVVELSAQQAAASTSGFPSTVRSMDFFHIFLSDAVNYRRAAAAAADCGAHREASDENVEPGDLDPHADDVIGSATVYPVDQGGQIVGVAIPQHEHYALRGTHEDLIDLTLWEWSVSVNVVPVKALAPAQKATLDGDAPAPAPRGGRQPNAVYRFHPGHKLYATHVQRVASKVLVPRIVGLPPCPSPLPGNASDAATRKHNAAFSRFVVAALTLHSVWNASTVAVLPTVAAWHEKLAECSARDAPFRLSVTLQLLIQLATALAVVPLRRAGLRQWRARAAHAVSLSTLRRQAIRWPSFRHPNQSGDVDGPEHERGGDEPADDVDLLRVAQQVVDLQNKHGSLEAEAGKMDARRKTLMEANAAAARVADELTELYGPPAPPGAAVSGAGAARASLAPLTTLAAVNAVLKTLQAPVTADELREGLGDAATTAPVAAPRVDLPAVRDEESIRARCAAANMTESQTAFSLIILLWALCVRDADARGTPRPPAPKLLLVGAPGTGTCDVAACMRPV